MSSYAYLKLVWNELSTTLVKWTFSMIMLYSQKFTNPYFYNLYNQIRVSDFNNWENYCYFYFFYWMSNIRKLPIFTLCYSFLLKSNLFILSNELFIVHGLFSVVFPPSNYQDLHNLLVSSFYYFRILLMTKSSGKRIPFVWKICTLLIIRAYSVPHKGAEGNCTNWRT